MHTALLAALEGNTGAARFSQSIDIVSLDAERLLDRLAHFLRPRLSSEDTCLEVEVIGSKTELSNGLADISSIRRCTAEESGVKVLHELYLSVRASRAHRERQTTDLM